MSTLKAFHQKQLEVAAVLAELASLADEVGARTLGARVQKDLVTKLQEDKFHLVVVGEFNHGKSTFVNALLGSDILPVGVTPTTAAIHHVEYADEPRAAFVTESGDKTPIAFDEVRRFAVGGETSNVAYLEVGYPSPLLKDRIVLVDTPGVNDLSLQRADITYNYIPKSDAVLFLLDAGQPLKESERVFLQQKLLGQSRDKIIFLVTKSDIWDDDERKEALDYIELELHKLVKTPRLFPISAQRALSGQRPTSGMPEATEYLGTYLAEERGTILLDNALKEADRAARSLERGLDARRRAATMPIEELDRRIVALEKDLAGQAHTIEQRRATIREEVSAIKAWVKRDLEHFRQDVTKQIPAMVDNASADEIKVHLGPFIEQTLKNWAEKETKEVAAALEKVAETTVALIRDDAHDVAKRVSQTLGGPVESPSIEVDTFGYDVGVVALFTLGFGMLFTNALLGGIMTAAAPVLAMYVKSRVERETRDKARELAPKVIQEATEQVGPKLLSMIDDFAKALDEWIVAAGEEMHRQVIEVLSSAKEERSKEGARTEAGVQHCDELAERLTQLETRLGGLRAELLPETVAPDTTEATEAVEDSQAEDGQAEDGQAEDSQAEAPPPAQGAAPGSSENAASPGSMEDAQEKATPSVTSSGDASSGGASSGEATPNEATSGDAAGGGTQGGDTQGGDTQGGGDPAPNAPGGSA